MTGRLMYLALMLSLCIISASYAELATSLSGCWKNELGSTMKIDVNEAGHIRGTYVSQVSMSKKPAEGVVVGYQQDLTQPTFGFIVKWIKAATSVSVWAGQYFKVGDEAKLITIWLLRASCLDQGENWNATRVGMDVFSRNDTACKLTNLRSESGEMKQEVSSDGEFSGSYHA
ncbi:avidin-like [Carcharodon carcharias]|uniref:avidin-like n=1 Tax=Carcharodon carcharias TaxID=13397 RepID=UPI001B7F3828|nr:avidin-like [Carcharodon carcharias]